MLLRKLYTALFVTFFGVLLSQNDNLRIKSILIDKDSIQIDTLSIDLKSIRFLNPGDSLLCKIDPLKKIIFRIRKDSVFVVKLEYRVFPIDFNKKYINKDIGKLARDFSRPDNPINLVFDREQKKKSEIFQQDGLSKNGSISRGIQFGNNQDVVVNSGLNLQLSGKLTNEIQLSLAATDNNIPLQPDGNTQQLQEFDKVFIQLNDEKSKLVAGDFQLERPKSYFMNFYKRMQGALFTNKTMLKISENNTGYLSSTVSGAVSRGRFARNIIQGVENNQGPYRLTGADKENFIIILSGTEKVYIDGRLLTRGQENDYIIDYNNSEVSFTAKNIITKDKRIIVEFQYAERNYARALYYANTEWTTKKTRVFFNFYQEADNKNRTLMQELNDSNKVLLSLVGDTISSAVIPGFQISEFNSLEVFYRKTDTTVNAILYPNVFVYNTSPDSVSYRIKFSFVGTSKGNYIQTQSSANGRVYKWIAPTGGIPQGDFEPVIQLVTPKKKQMLTVGTENKLGKEGKVSIEGVLTLDDKNTFSRFDSKDDHGQGIKFNLSNKHILTPGDSIKINSLQLNYALGYEFLQKNFSQIERFRSIEFDRDWNRDLKGIIINDQHIVNSNIGFNYGKIWNAAYNLNSFIEGNQYSGMKHTLSNYFNSGPLKVLFNSSLMNSASSGISTRFYRHKSSASIKIKSLQFSYTDEFENNRFKEALLISPRSYQFWEWEGSLSSIDTGSNSFKLFYRERNDLKAYTQQLSDSAFAQNAGLQFQFNKNRNHVVRSNITLRKMEFRGMNFANSNPDNNFLGRLEYFPRFLNGFFQSTIFIESGYGLELRREFSYIEVAAGQGQYFWNDYNGNGIKELNEFEVAQFPDQAIYIRVWTPTNTYTKVNRDQFSYSMTLKPSAIKKKNSGDLMKFLSRFVTQTVYRLDRKTQSNQGLERINIFNADASDSLLTGMNYNFRQALFFNQSSPVFGFDYTYSDNRNKQLLTNGFDARQIENNELRIRLNITKDWAFFQNSNTGTKTNLSEFFTTRNYKIFYFETESRIAFQPSTAFRIVLSYKYTSKENKLPPEGQKANFNDIGTEIKYNKLGKGSVIAKFNFIGITFNSPQNTPVAFEMLNALKTGNNLTWNINYQQNLSNNLQISITYDGRKSTGNKMVHIGGAQVRAFF